MEYRKFGGTDLMVSEKGFGAWGIGGPARIGAVDIGWGRADDSLSKLAIHAALDAGINFFDTADIYGFGHSEELLGKILGKEAAALIATKGGNVARNGQFTSDYSKPYLINACEQSLRRLRRDTIDFYQLHSARLSHLQDGDCVEAMEQLKREGKIRYWGISVNTFDPEPEIDWLITAAKGNGVQLVLNLLNRKAASLLKKINEAGFGVIARMPLQFGLLTGKISPQSQFDSGDHRKKRLNPEVISAAREIMDRLQPICTKYNCSLAQLALAYVLSFPEVSVTIPGLRTPEQVKENTLKTVKIEDEDLQIIASESPEKLNRMMDLLIAAG